LFCLTEMGLERWNVTIERPVLDKLGQTGPVPLLKCQPDGPGCYTAAPMCPAAQRAIPKIVS
jgi:hypothetical protein